MWGLCKTSVQQQEHWVGILQHHTFVIFYGQEHLVSPHISLQWENFFWDHTSRANNEGTATPTVSAMCAVSVASVVGFWLQFVNEYSKKFILFPRVLCFCDYSTGGIFRKGPHFQLLSNYNIHKCIIYFIFTDSVSSLRSQLSIIGEHINFWSTM